MKRKIKRVKKKEFNLDRYIFAASAKIWRWWPPRKKAIELATVWTSDGEEAQVCHNCNDVLLVIKGKKGKKKRQVDVDHIIPVVDPEKGFEGWDNYFKRKYVTVDKLQVLCKVCHKAKSNSENSRRIR